MAFELTKEHIQRAAAYLLTGKGHYITPGMVDAWQLKEGIKVEYEHTKFKWVATIIALDHLYEFPDYYTRLLQLEKDAEADKRRHVRLPNRRAI